MGEGGHCTGVAHSWHPLYHVPGWIPLAPVLIIAE